MPSGDSITFKLRGADALTRLAASASTQARAAVKGVIVTYAIKIERKLKKELSKGGSGRKYKVGDTIRQASAPGESPATQTARYESAIHHELMGLAAKVTTGSELDYPAALEFGTSDIEPRPMWRPIIEEEVSNFRRDIVSVLDKVL